MIRYSGSYVTRNPSYKKENMKLMAIILVTKTCDYRNI